MNTRRKERFKANKKARKATQVSPFVFLQYNRTAFTPKPRPAVSQTRLYDWTRGFDAAEYAKNYGKQIAQERDAFSRRLGRGGRSFE